MKNRFYLKTRESKSERLSPYNAYKVYKGGNGLWYFEDDGGYCDGYKTMSEMEDAVRTKENTEAEIIALASDVFFFRYTGYTNETFTKDKIYVLRLNKIDFSAENPYRNCIEGIEVPLNCEDPEVKIKQPTSKDVWKEILFHMQYMECLTVYFSTVSMQRWKLIPNGINRKTNGKFAQQKNIRRLS